jgi:subtilase family serine protease
VKDRFVRTILSEMAIGAALFFLLITTATAAERQTLQGHVPAAVAKFGLQPVGRLPATNRISLAIGLALRNRPALTNLLQQLYDPASTNFHQYLSSEQFTEQFGPLEADYQKVLQFARTNGLTVVTTFSHRQLVEVSATVSDIEKAFQVNLRTYQHPTEPREFFAPDVEPSVDAGVPIQAISGLSSFDRSSAGAHLQSNTQKSAPANGTGPGGNTYRGKDFRNAYAPGVSLNGAGQYVGLVELDGYYNSDITTYESQAGLPTVPLSIVPLAGSSSFPTTNVNFVAEVSLDIEMVISMAPGLTTLYIFEGNNFDTILGSMASYTFVKQFSSSWFGFGFDSTGDGLLQTMAAQGQTFFQASGDGDAYTSPVLLPADDLYVTSVGGTSLTMDATATSYVSETVWNSGFQSPAWPGNGGVSGGGYWGSGGGVSSTYGFPGWQSGVNMAALGGSTSKRNIPDVALTGVNVWVNYFNGQAGGFEGTSCAAPLWAGFTALVNEQAAGSGKPAVGFLNPVLYAIGEGPNYNACFHDITTGNNTWPGSPSKFQTFTGYDLCTGWGTPNGAKMITALANFGGPIYVDFNYTGSTQNGSYNAPFKTLAGGTNAVSTGGTIIIRTAGTSAETMTISKAMTISTLGGAGSVGN